MYKVGDIVWILCDRVPLRKGFAKHFIPPNTQGIIVHVNDIPGVNGYDFRVRYNAKGTEEFWFRAEHVCLDRLIDSMVMVEPDFSLEELETAKEMING